MKNKVLESKNKMDTLNRLNTAEENKKTKTCKN